MSRSPQNDLINTENVDPRWKDLYRIGGISSILIAASIILAVAAFFIWPFRPGFTSTVNIFMALQKDKLGGLISLDLFMVLIAPINILPFLALYVVLRKVNESYALIALVVGLIAVAVLIPARPIAELALLSDKYTAATTEAERSQYLTAGESLHALFNGTAWMTQTVLFGLSGLIYSLLMLRTKLFSNTTAYAGISAGILGFGFFLPVIGPVLLFVTTILSVVWFIFMSRDFFRLKLAGG